MAFVKSIGSVALFAALIGAALVFAHAPGELADRTSATASLALMFASACALVGIYHLVFAAAAHTRNIGGRAVRAEIFLDEDGARKYRHDRANRKVFAATGDGTVPTSRSQDTISITLDYLFF